MTLDTKELFASITGKNVRTLEKIEFGFNNDNYLINDAFVMRVSKENPDETLSLAKEAYLHKTIAPLNISEIVTHFDKNLGVKVSKFVHSSRKYVKTPTNEQIIYVCKKLKKLHSSGLVVPFGYMMFHKFSVYKKLVDKDLYINKTYENKVIKAVQGIFAKTPMTICHNDLVKDNLLFKFDDVVFIDWEYGGMNNPYFDLASFISENNLNDDQIDFFLGKYFGFKYNAMRRKRVLHFCDFQDLLFYYWAHYLYKKRKDPRYLEIANIKKARIDAKNIREK